MMTGNIKEKLFNSETVETIQMESSVSNLLSNLGWNIYPSYYYTDLKTDKLREIDVYAQRLFQVPRLKKFTGAPLVNFHLICECKSLAGSNIIVVPFKKNGKSRRIPNFWLGSNDNLSRTCNLIFKIFDVRVKSKKKEIYDFMLAKAYPEHGKAITITSMGDKVSNFMPETEVECNIFRETKFGSELKEGESAIWRTVQSLFSSTDAVFKRERDRFRNNCEFLDLEVEDPKETASWVAFLLFENLLRRSYFHPFLVTKAKIWSLGENGVEPAKSARLFVAGLFKDDEYLNERYVDIVHYDNFAEYIEDAAKLIERNANTSLKKLADYIENSGWLEKNGRESFENLLAESANY